MLSVALVACGGGGGGGVGGVEGSASQQPSGSPTPSTYEVGGTVSGLVGTGLILSDGAGHSLAIAPGIPLVFPTALAQGTRYNVSVVSQPTSPAQTCVVSPATSSGAVSGANVTNVQVSCATNAHRLGGTISGLAGSGLVLRNADGDTLAPAANGVFDFTTPKASGSSYDVTVASQPGNPSQTCSVSGGSGHGLIVDADIADISVVCSTDAFAISGVANGLTGSGLVLQQNGADDLAVQGDGSFGFHTRVASGAGYKVTVKTQPTNPTQICTVSDGAGLVTIGDVAAVRVSCATEAFLVHGTVTGLMGRGLVLEDNGADDLTVGAAGDFVFPTGVVSGARYTVSVRTQPSNPSQTCSVGMASTGLVGAADVTGVGVVCSTNSYAVGGTVKGLSSAGLVLQDNAGDDIVVAADGSFRFPTLVASGGNYAVTVRSVPDAARQSCSVVGGSGTVSGSDVADVQVTCSTAVARFAWVTQWVDSLSLGWIDGSITPYPIDPATGAPGAPGALAGTGRGGAQVVVSPSGTFAWVPNRIALSGSTLGSVTSFRVDPGSGALTPNGPEVLAGRTSVAMVVHPSGKFAYVANHDDSTLSVFSIAPLTGLLSPVQTVSGVFTPSSLAMQPTGHFLYVASESGSIGAFAIDGSAGTLTHVSDIASVGEPRGVAAHPSGRFIFEFDYSSNVGTAAITSFAIDPATGSLTRLNVVGTGVSPSAIAVHPSGRFLYVGNFGGPDPRAGTGWIPSGSITIVSVDPATGQLSEPLPELTTGRGARCMAMDPSGRFLYMTNSSTDVNFTKVLSSFAIDSDTGALSVAVPDVVVPYGCVSVW